MNTKIYIFALLVFIFPCDNRRCDTMASIGGFCNCVVQRNFSLTAACNGKRNFRKFILHNRGTKAFKEKQKTDPHPEVPVYSKLYNEV